MRILIALLVIGFFCSVGNAQSPFVPTFKVFQSKVKGEEEFLVFQTKYYKYTKTVVDRAKKEGKPLLLFVDCEPRRVDGFVVTYSTLENLTQNGSHPAKSGEVLLSYYEGDNFFFMALDGKSSERQIKDVYKKLTKDRPIAKAAGKLLVVVPNFFCSACDRLKNVTLPRLRGELDVQEVHDVTVQTYPTMIYMKDGKEVWRVSGFRTAEELKGMIK